jgi:hypothetical protein
MASATGWPGTGRMSGRERADTYRERAAQLTALAHVEADPRLSVQLRDLARQYEESARSIATRPALALVVREGTGSRPRLQPARL